jgi:PII-like signaling protein
MTHSLKMLIVFLNEVDRVDDEPTYELVMRRLRSHDAAGATVFFGMMGFGHHHRLHHKGLFGIADDRPITITVVDTEEKIHGLLPEVRSLVPDALMLLVNAELVGGTPR